MKTINSKALLMLSLCLFFCGTITAQDIDLLWGESIDTKNQIVKIVGETETGTYAVSARKKTFYLEFYEGEAFKPKSSQELIPPKIKGEQTEFTNVFYLEGNMMMFSHMLDKESRTYNIYGSMLDSKGKVVGKPKEIIKAKVESRTNRGTFGFRISPDRSKMIVTHTALYKEGEDYFGTHIRLLTSGMDLIKEFKEKFPRKEDKDRYGISDFFVSNTGATYMAYQKYGKLEKQWVNKELNIIQWEPRNGFEKLVIPVDLKNKQATSITLNMDKDGNLIGGGFYNENYKGLLGKITGLAGTYFVRINWMDGSVMALNTSKFGEELAATILSEKAAKKGRLIPDEFYMKKVIPKEDGGAVMVAEYFAVYTSSQSNVRNHIHGPIIVANVNPEGEILWVRSVIKNQLYQQPGMMFFGGGVSLTLFLSTQNAPIVYHSFVIGIHESTIYMLFNDNPNNIEIKHYRKTKVLTNASKATPVVVSIDAEGNVDKQVFKRDKQQVVLRPGVSFQDDFNKVIIFGTRGRDEKLGMLLF